MNLPQFVVMFYFCSTVFPFTKNDLNRDSVFYLFVILYFSHSMTSVEIKLLI